MFSSKSFIVSGLTFRSLIHFEFIFLYGVRKCSNFTLLYVAAQFSQNCILKKLSFPHCIFWKLMLCQLFHLLLFFQFWELSFHLAYSFFCGGRAFKYNQVPLVYFCFYFHYSKKSIIEDLALIYLIECSAYVFL